MSAIQEPPVFSEHALPEDPDAATIAALADLRHEMRAQSRSIKSTQQAFSIFAGMALLIAMASLIAIAVKLDRKPKTIVQRVVAAAPAKTPAQAPVPLPRNVDVKLEQFSVSPSVARAAAGKVTFRVHNAGTITHELVVIKTPRAAADLPITKGRASESGNVGETGDLKAGRTKSFSVKLAPGHYALICNLPGHYLAGQHTDFSVR